jgi:hypothetical protein
MALDAAAASGSHREMLTTMLKWPPVDLTRGRFRLAFPVDVGSLLLKFEPLTQRATEASAHVDVLPDGVVQSR